MLVLCVIMISLIGQCLGSDGVGIREAALALLAYLWIFAIFLKMKKKNKDFIWGLIGAVFWLRVLLALLNYSIPLFPPSQDALENNEVALQLSSAWREGSFFPSLSHDVELSYVVPTAIIYSIFGYNLYLGCLINILAGTAAIFFIYQTGLLLFGRREAMVGSVIFSLMPYLNFLSVFFNREILILFLMTVIGYLAVSWISKGYPQYKYVLFGAAFCLAFLRPENLIWLIPYFVVVYILCSSMGFFEVTLILGILSVLIFSVVGFYLLDGSKINTLEPLSFLHLQGVSPEALYGRAYRHTDFGFAYLPDAIPRSWVSVFFPYGISQTINFLVRPFPWEVFRSSQIYLVLNNLTLYCLYLLGLLGLLRLMYTRNISISIGVISFMSIGIFLGSLVHGNAFAAVRHREQFIFFVYVLASSGLITLLEFVKTTALEHRWHNERKS